MSRNFPGTARGALAAGALASLLAAACAELETLPEGTCGNRVREPDAGEDCDGEEGCGQPDGAHPCRFTCSPPGGECPGKETGYACGADGVCRRPTGQFAPLQDFVTSFSRDLKIDDINRDGCDEIVLTTLRGTAITALPSAADGLCSASSQEIPAGAPPPAQQSIPPAPMLADISNDARPEILLPARGFYGDGLFVHLAGPSPAVTPLLHPTLRVQERRVRPLSVAAPAGHVLFVFLSPLAGGDAMVAAVPDPAEKALPLGGSLPGALADIAFLAAADLDPAPGAPPCDEVIAGFAGQAELHLYRTCDAGPGPVFKPLGKVALSGGAKIRGRNAAIAVADIDGDGAPDLIVNTTKDELHVAHGDGAGRFHSTPPLPGTTPDQQTGVLAFPGDMQSQKLRAELVSQDSRFVAADFLPEAPGVEMSAIPCPSSGETGSPGCMKHSGECEAQVADLDLDGYLDAAFTLGADPSIILARGGKGPTPHVTLLQTQCPPVGLTTGDFDGDGITDVAFIDPVAVDGVSAATVSIAYGRAFAAPEAPVVSGRLEGASGLAAGRFVAGGSGVQIYASLDRPEATGGQAPSGGPGGGVALVTDRGERTSSAAFYLPAGAESMENLELVELAAATAGRFTSGSETASPFGLVVLTRDLASAQSFTGDAGTERLWLLLPRGGGGSSLEPLPGQNTVAPPCDACLLVPVATDGDSIDEVLLLAGGEGSVYGITAAGLELRTVFPLARSYRSLAEAGSVPRKYTPEPLVTDLDGDGRSEVLLRAADGMLVVLWGNAQGTFDEVALEEVEGCEGTESCAAALLDAGGDPGLELVAVGPTGTFLFEIDPKARRVTRGAPVGAPGPLPEGSDFAAVRAGDLDGDGVSDLVILRTSGFASALRGVPEND